jgi:hypothetical protein
VVSATSTLTTAESAATVAIPTQRPLAIRRRAVTPAAPRAPVLRANCPSVVAATNIVSCDGMSAAAITSSESPRKNRLTCASIGRMARA